MASGFETRVRCFFTSSDISLSSTVNGGGSGFRGSGVRQIGILYNRNPDCCSYLRKPLSDLIEIRL